MSIARLPEPHLDATRLSRNKNYKPAAMQAILVNVVRLFNETVDALTASQTIEPRRVLLQGVVLNLFMIDKLLGLVEPAREVNPVVKDLRDCIAHFDERVKKYYNSPNPVPPSTFDSPNIRFGADGSITVSDLSLDGVTLDIDSTTSSTLVSAPFGMINDTLVGLDRDGATLQIRIDAGLLAIYRGDIAKVVAGFS